MIGGVADENGVVAIVGSAVVYRPGSTSEAFTVGLDGVRQGKRTGNLKSDNAAMVSIPCRAANVLGCGVGWITDLWKRLL